MSFPLNDAEELAVTHLVMAYYKNPKCLGLNIEDKKQLKCLYSILNTKQMRMKEKGNRGEYYGISAN